MLHSEPPFPHIVVQDTDHPYEYKDNSLHGCKDSATNNNKSANDCKKRGDEDERLDRSMQSRFPPSEDDGAQDSQEEEGILREAVQCKEQAHVAEEDVDC